MCMVVVLLLAMLLLVVLLVMQVLAEYMEWIHMPVAVVQRAVCDQRAAAASCQTVAGH
jgi:hypothetical protein